MNLTSSDSDNKLDIRVVTEAQVEDAIEAHAEKCEFQGGYHSPETYDAWVEAENGGRKYGGLNYALHDKLRDAMRSHFQSRPLPNSPSAELEEPRERYRAFTYQNFDWFTTNSQVRMQIAGDCLSCELITAIQAILTDEHAAWGVVLLATASSSFDKQDTYKLLVTRSEVLIPSEFLGKYRQ